MIQINLYQQTDWISCGPASLMSAISALGLPVPEFTQLCKELEVQSFPVGTDDARLTDPKIIQSLGLNVTASGESAYNGGLAIANITKTVGDMSYGHYVLMLGQRGNTVRYFDPEDGKVIESDLSQIKWVNGRGDRKKWAMCFDAGGKDFYEAEVSVKKAPKADIPLPYFSRMSDGSEKPVVTFDQQSGLKTIPADPRFLQWIAENSRSKS